MKSGMINWKARQILKRNKASRTPGKAKGENCQTDATKKFYFSSPKAYKDKDYDRWHELSKRLNAGARM